MTVPVIQFRSVSCHFGGREVLSQLDLTVHQGETFVLVGRSGCGKTTTLRMVNRLVEPSQGEVLVEGTTTHSWDPITLRRRIGYVIQDVGLFPHLTVERNVGLIPSLEKWSRHRIRARARTLLATVGLDPSEYASRYPWQLSGGERQRVGVARALALDPPILLMDEPFGALDPVTRSEIQEEFQKLQEELQKTILFVTHDLQEALLLGTRIGLMNEGRLVNCSSPAELLGSQQPEVMAFLRPLRQALMAPLTGLDHQGNG